MYVRGFAERMRLVIRRRLKNGAFLVPAPLPWQGFSPGWSAEALIGHRAHPVSKMALPGNGTDLIGRVRWHIRAGRALYVLVDYFQLSANPSRAVWLPFPDTLLVRRGFRNSNIFRTAPVNVLSALCFEII